MAAGPGPFVNQLQHSQSDLGAFESQQRLEESRFGQVFIAESNSGNRITEADFGSDTDFTIPTSFVEESRKLESDSELMRNEAFEIKGELYHQNPKSQFFTGKGSTLRERIPASDYGRFLANIPISQAFHSTSIIPGERMHPNNEPSPGKTEAPIEIQQTTTFAKTDSNTAMVKQQKPPPPTGPKPKSFQLVKNQQTLSVPAKSNGINFLKNSN